MLSLSLSRTQLAAFAKQSLEFSSPDGQPCDVDSVLDETLDRLGECLSSVRLAGYRRDGQPHFNHLHGDQSAAFWYLLSNTAFRRQDRQLAEKCMLFNKSRNGILITYDTVLPTHFLLIHTVGTMLGKADYGDYFVATQNVTVGTHKGNAPVFGRGVILYPQSFIAGRCRIGDFARVAVKSTLMDIDCPTGHTASGQFPDVSIAPSRRQTIGDYFDLAAINGQQRGK